MNILILGDVVGISGRKAINKNLQEIIKKFKIDFTIVNGENAADDGKGITEKISINLFDLGVDVITSGNHIWDKKETSIYIDKEKKLLRPSNFIKGTPGNGFGTFKIKNTNYKVGVINLIGNVFMKNSENMFDHALELKKKMQLKKNVDFLIIDIHAEITSEKMALGHFYDGEATCVIGTHTHVPTADTRILEKGTAYQTDLGMCGDYNSVIGMNKENSLKKFLKQGDAKGHFPSVGEATLSGIIVEACEKTGLAKKVHRFIEGGRLK